MADLRHPIGPWMRTAATPQTVDVWISEIEAAVGHFRDAVEGLDDSRLDTRYRPGGWTVRQVIHHVADSHINAYVRFRLALTEEEPTIRPYDEAAWAELADARGGPVGVSLDLAEAVHVRWVGLARSLDATALARRYFHPEAGESMRIDEMLSSYAWHSRHHCAHITELGRREGWARG